MNNYYETCLKTIQSLISDGNRSEALQMIDEELSMPYVPQDYLNQFELLRDSLRVDKKPHQKYFESIDEIVEGLRGNDLLQQKSLMSLERMNLRAELDDSKEILLDEKLPDWIKKQILFFLMGQNINQSVEVYVNGSKHIINIATLENPIESQAYQKCILELRDALESWNPSLLILCVAELDQRVMDSFPLSLTTLDAQDIIDTVNGYLNTI